MEEEKRKRRALETGRELLESYKSNRSKKKIEQVSDEESFQNEPLNQSMDLKSISNNESGFSRDITYSSVSMSEGEGDADLEGLAGRVTELEELLQGKEAVVQALNAEIDHLRADASSPTSSHSQTSHKDIIVTYHTKLQEFETAINQRDNLIEDLTTSLQQALASRDSLLKQINSLNSTQLGLSNEEIPSEEKISALEIALSKQKELVSELKSQLDQAQQNIKRLEIEKEMQNTELSDYKSQVENLNKKIRANSTENDTSISDTHKLQKQYEEQVEKIKKDMKLIVDKFTDETKANNIKHEKEMKDLKLQYEMELQKLQEENKYLKFRHDEQLSSCKRTIESLKLELVTRKANHAKDQELLNEQIKLHKLQLEELTSKFLATTSVLESKESIERSLQQALDNATLLKTENESLKFKLEDLSSRYMAAQSLIENGQIQERTLSNKIFTLEKSLSRLSGISISELDETAYQTLDTISLQFQQKLEEKEELEKKLVEKISDLESLVETTRKDLESAKLTNESYEKQIKDMKNMCDRLKSEMTSSLEQQQRMSADSLDVMRMASTDFEQEIIQLKRTIEKRDEETTEYIRKLEELKQENQKLAKESEQLKVGLAAAYAQCAIFEEKLDQTLGFADSKLDNTSLLMDQTNFSDISSFDHQDSHRQFNYNKVLQKLDTCRKQLGDYECEKMDLLQEIEKKSKENKELLMKAQEKDEQLQEEIKILKREAAAESQKFQQLLAGFEEGNTGLKQLRTEMEEKHAKEMEELRTYFEQKCLQMEKQYSEEIFSQQSRKMSDNDSEIEELTEDLYIGNSTVNCPGDSGGGGGDAAGGVDNDIANNFSSNTKHENNLEDRIAKIRAEYEEKLENLSKQLEEVKENSGQSVLLKAANQFCQTEQSNVALVQESFKELNELRADYNRQLKEQVGLARTDIINALQEQIQALITVDNESEENWPSEMLELRNKFTSNTKREIQSLKEQHAEEIKLLKEEHNKTVNDLHEEIRKIRLESHMTSQNNLLKERDTLYKSCAILRSLVGQLINYFVKCEEELNNTLISEIIRKGLTGRQDNVSVFESDESAKVKRVHFAPQSLKISSIVNKDNDFLTLINAENDITSILKNDLDSCLERLKTDSAKLLNTSVSDSESWSTGIGDSPSEKLIEAEKVLAGIQEENEHLKVKLIELQQRVLMSERKKEVISEGYGEQDESTCEELNEDFSQLQERAKFVVNNGSNDTVYLLQLIDDLCRHVEKSKEEMRREKEDLQHQIEAADKQLRLTRKFQEEQAIEREAERDEAVKEIEHLQERLREREREKDRDFHTEQSALSPASSSADSSTLRQTVDESQMSESVETLTTQMRELETKNTEMGNELKEAVGKIHELREVIRELEQQVEERQEREEILSKQNEVLQEVIVAQTKNQQELVQELEVAKAGSENNQLSDHIGHLQEELRKHQLSSEQLTANSSALKQLRLEIRELQSQLDRKTRELESLHVCGSSLSLSQPSEDVSIREQIDALRCPTPDDPTSPPILPLDHILKLKDTLLKHFRAEDVALKRLKDFEIQLSALQRQNEELLAEQDLLQQTISEQLFQIEALRARLEQQKQNAPFAHRQATSRLESQLYETSDKLEIAERAVADKNVEITELKNQIERVKRLLAEKENEIANVVQSEDDAIRKLKQKLEIVEEENSIIKGKLNVQEKAQTNLPQVIDAMLAEKNEEIDQLKEQLMRREKQLEVYLSLDEAQLRELLRHNEQQKNSARTLSDILSINSECEEISEAIREAANFTRFQNVSNLKVANSAVPSTLVHSKRDVVDFSEAITETPKVPRLELDSHSSDVINSNVIEVSKEMESLQMQMQPNERMSLVGVSSLPGTDTETHADELNASGEQSSFVCPRHDNMNYTSHFSNEPLHSETATAMVQRIRELEINLCEIKEELSAKSFALEQRESELLQLQENVKSLNDSVLFYKVEYDKIKDGKTKIEKDLEESENLLKKRTEELETYKEKMQVDEKILYEESMRCKRSETALQEKLKEITYLKEIISEKDITIETLQSRNVEFENEIKDLYDYRNKFENYQQEIIECQNEIQRLSEGLNSRDQMIRRLEEMARRSSLSGESSPSEKDQEIYHLQEYLKEKDKVIRQMSDDSKSLHRALETIQNKMKESGNIVELRRKLKEERKNNVEMAEEIARLRTEVEMLSTTRRPDEDNDIAEMVKRELNLSARLDQQLLNVIDSEPEDVLKKCTDLKQANKEIDELNRIKDDLEIESEMLKSQITEYENRILQLRADIEEKSSRFTKLEEELARERHMVRSLQMQLHREKNAAAEDKVRDTELISQLRIKLDEAFDVRDRLILEQKNLEVMRSMHSNTKDETSNKKNNFEKEQLEIKEQLEMQRSKNIKDRDTLKQVEKERDRLQSLYETLKAEREKLISNIETADCVKDELKTELRRVQEELKAKTKECDWHKSMLKTINDAEVKRSEQRSNQQTELKNLKRVMMDVESEMKALKEQLTEAAEHEIQSTHYIEALKDKEADLVEQLSAAKNEERELREIIADQQNELKIYLKKEMELADELKWERLSLNKNHSPNKILQRIKDLNTSIERLSQDKVLLYEKLERLREENVKYLDQIKFLETQLSQKVKDHPIMVNRNDSEERLQHFYGRYLRSESRRKALIYQKSYLFCIIAGYQHLEENTLSFLAQLTQQQRAYVRHGAHRRNAKVRFRSAVLLIISIQRMKWLILRWRTGRRVGANVVLGSIDRAGISSTRQRNVSGHSPPVRDRTLAPAAAYAVNGINSFSHDPYLRRFTDIQQNLHLRVPESSTNNFNSDAI